MAPIAIIGGGPSGLAFARLLELRKIEYVVYERDSSAYSAAGQQGGSLDLHASTGQAVMTRCGLTEAFEKQARRVGHAVLVDKTGKQLIAFGDGRDAPEIDRAQLRTLLAESIPPEKIHWNKAVTAVQTDEAGEVFVNFADGSTASGFGLVVGADGAWSRVRPLLTESKPVHSDKHYLEAHISTTNPIHHSIKSRVAGGALLAVGSGKHVAAQAMSDGSYRIYIALLAPEDLFTTKTAVDLAAEDGAVARRYFISSAKYFADWALEIKDIIAHCEGPFRHWPLYHMPPEALNWASVPGVVLLGDAAHLSTPFVGEGVNCALVDALELADQIAKNGASADGLKSAVAAYEKGMFSRGRSLIERSNESAGLLFADDPSQLLQVISSKGNSG